MTYERLPVGGRSRNVKDVLVDLTYRGDISPLTREVFVPAWVNYNVQLFKAVIMKKTVFLFICILIILLISYFSFCIYRNVNLSTNIENGSYGKCFDDVNVISRTLSVWDGENPLNIKFIGKGNVHCFAPNFPSLEVSSKRVTHWIHIVKATGDVQLTGKHSSLIRSDDYWTFVDVGAQKKRDKGIPFYDTGSVFRDNPGWTFPPHVSLSWVGNLFGLVEKDGIFYPVGGLAWGFNLNAWTLNPEAIEPEPLEFEAWLNMVDSLNKEYPSYQFSKQKGRI